jgi:hypothetical protein
MHDNLTEKYGNDVARALKHTIAFFSYGRSTKRYEKLNTCTGRISKCNVMGML